MLNLDQYRLTQKIFTVRVVRRFGGETQSRTSRQARRVIVTFSKQYAASNTSQQTPQTPEELCPYTSLDNDA